MIQFTLRCDNGHRFDSWFQSADAFDKLAASDMVSCSVCGSLSVEKALMAPQVQASRDKAPDAPPDMPRNTPPGEGRAPGGAGPLSAPASAADEALARLRQKLERESDYVGLDFAREARDMHAGLVPERPIHGEARVEEARKLVEEGVPVMPLPFLPGRKSN